MDISVLVGKTLIDVRNIDNEALYFETSDEEYKMYHIQDCCEYVSIEDICGDLTDLIGEPVLAAYEYSISGEGRDDGSYTYTFYKIETRKGGVTIRWYGSSNGYYSESVDFEEV